MKFCSVQNCKAPNFSIDKVTKLPYCRMHQTSRTDYDRRTIIRKAMDKQKGLETKVRSLVNTSANLSIASKVKKVVDSELELWYLARRYQMVGSCKECGKPTQPKHDKWYRWSIAHICAKSTVPSVKTNYHNWIELCQTCHQEFDNTFERASKMKCFHEAKLKFSYFKDLIPPDELRKVNPYLLQT